MPLLLLLSVPPLPPSKVSLGGFQPRAAAGLPGRVYDPTRLSMDIPWAGFCCLPEEHALSTAGLKS